MSRMSDMTLDRFDGLKIENTRLAAALGVESERLTLLMDDAYVLLHTLTSEAAAEMPPLLKAAVQHFLRLHPEVAPR